MRLIKNNIYVQIQTLVMTDLFIKNNYGIK